MSQRYEIPIQQDLADELFAFWKEIFGPGDPDVPMGVFLGDEVDHNRLVTYLERDGGTLTGTCGITISRASPRLAGFGEVATRPDYRGRGIASRLCGQAVEEFVEQGGRPSSSAPATPTPRASTTDSAGAGSPALTFGPE